jgi:uncharacterized surface anchored protein
LDGTLRVAAGTEVAMLTTDSNGEAVSGELYLGSYTVVESTTPDGYALNPTGYPAELTYKGQPASVNVKDVYTTDQPTTLEIVKLDAGTGEPLGGVSFAIEDSAGNITEVTTGADGHAAYPYLLQGSYRVYETVTIFGYILPGEIREVTVDENGLMEGQATCTLTFTNDCTKVRIRKADITTGEAVIGARSRYCRWTLRATSLRCPSLSG